MAIWKFIRTTLIDPLLNLRLWLLQFLGMSLLLAVFAWFLHIGDAFWWQLALSAVLALVMVSALVMLQGGTMNYFLDRERSTAKTAELMPAIRRTMGGLLPLIALAIVFYLLESQIERLYDYQYSFPGWLRSESPAWLRRMISENALDNVYSTFVVFLRWVVLPGLLLPVAQLFADLGFRGFTALRLWLRMIRRLRYWVLMFVPFIAVYCILLLMEMKLDPNTATLTGEKISLGIRLLVAFAIALSGWLIVCAGLARSRMKAEASPTAAETPAPQPVPAAPAKAEA